ncbi:MAG: hypothetical protein IJI14_04835 [Anaerolineaceae bacterium]|nr:hypothetical protein [Anaerolineaceae bacterium]
MIHHKQRFFIFLILFLPMILLSRRVFAQSPADYGRTWQDLPVLPEFNDHARRILKTGIMAGHDPHAFSKVGDCDTSTSWYLMDYDREQVYYDLGEYESLRPVLEFFHGSFGRISLAATPGFSAASVLSTYWTNYDYCNWGELPLECEYRIHDPLAVLISLGTNDGYNPPVFKENMKQIIELTLAQNRLPILMLKADNVEKDFSINQDIADLAKEYDLPVWNFWAEIQHLENHGLQEDGIHLTFYGNYFSHPKAWETAWAYRNLTALQVLEKLQFEIETILNNAQ